MENTIKIFKMNDCDWYAGETPEDAIRGMAEWIGYETTPEAIAEMCAELTVKPVELSDAELDQTMYEEVDGPMPFSQKLTFRERLAEMLVDGDEFPSFFASTEY